MAVAAAALVWVAVPIGLIYALIRQHSSRRRLLVAGVLSIYILVFMIAPAVIAQTASVDMRVHAVQQSP